MASPGQIIGGARAARAASPSGQGALSQPLGNTGPAMSQISPLVSQLGGGPQAGYATNYGNFLPRPTDAFQAGAFGPFSPIYPMAIDQPPDGAERAMPRRLPYQVGWNLPIGQPGTEGVKLADFQTLRSLANVYSVARSCIQLLKSEIRGLEWDITPTKDAAKAMRGDHKAMVDFGERRAKAVAFFKNPDPEYGSWSSWLDTLLEDFFAIDALSVYLRPTWGKGKGVLGSDLTALELIAGDTIRPLFDLHGSRPRPPAPAYQQFLWGVPRVDLMQLITQADLTDELKAGQVAEYRGDQLLYLPYTRQTVSPYGLPPIERALVPIMAGLGKQQYQLDFFREGCYDDATEILTRDGWKLFAKLDDGDEVATRSPSGQLEWQLPSDRQCYRSDGPCSSSVAATWICWSRRTIACWSPAPIRTATSLSRGTCLVAATGSTVS